MFLALFSRHAGISICFSHWLLEKKREYMSSDESCLRSRVQFQYVLFYSYAMWNQPCLELNFTCKTLYILMQSKKSKHSVCFLIIAKCWYPRYLLSMGEMECRLFGFSSHPPIQNKQYINKQNRMKKESEELSRVTKRLISCKRCRWSSPESCDSSAQVTGYNRQARAWSDCGMKEGESPGVSVHSFTLAARGVWKAGVSDPHVCGGASRAWVTVIASLVSSSVDITPYDIIYTWLQSDTRSQ